MIANLDAESIRAPITGMPRARLDELEVFAEIESTNSYLLDRPPPSPGRYRVALADHQTRGRGRFDRRWQSPPSTGLCLSLAYTFDRRPREFPCLTLALGVSVVEALERLGIEGVGLKWPNDLMARGAKLGGILTETRAGNGNTIVAGIGLNVDLRASPPLDEPLASRIVDLKTCASRLPSRARLSSGIIESLFGCLTRFEAEGFSPFRAGWERLDWLTGRSIVVEAPDGRCAGIADGIDRDGALMIRIRGERKRIVSGTIVLPDGREEDA